MTSLTASLGGMETNICTWSVDRAPLMMLTPNSSQT